MSSVLHHSDFRSYLKQELETRKERNRRYSLRAFSRDLGISPSQLCEIMKGNCGLSVKSIGRLSQRLELDDEEENYFRDLVQSESGNSFRKREIAKIRLKRRRSTQIVDMDVFKIIANWYHYGILELTYLQDFESDPRWISEQLDVPEDEIRAAIERLKRLKFLTESNGRLVATHEFSETPQEQPSEALKSFHKQLLNKAAEILNTTSGSQREFQSVVFATTKESLPAAKNDIRNFAKNFSSKYSSNKSKDSVFCLSVQFYELTKGT